MKGDPKDLERHVEVNMRTLREGERSVRELLRTGVGGPVDMIGADYLQLLVRANCNDEIDDDEFFNGLELLRRYLLKERDR